jgi:hypothetical protein
MQCSTSFTVPMEEQHEVPYQAALKFIQQMRHFTPYGYFSHVEVIKPHRFLTSHDNYRLLSFQQFECLLKCCSEPKNWAQYRFCQKNCLSKSETVFLNTLDATRYGKHDVD